MLPTTESRWIALNGAFNVRDLGGYPLPDGVTRWGELLRGDSLHRLTTDDQRRLIDYGLRTVIDLRHLGELETAPDVFSTSAEVAYHHASVYRVNMSAGTVSLPPDLAVIYRHIVDECQAGLRETLDIIADAPAGAVLFHCTAGKDRTGIVAALLLSLAGVAQDVILEDFALTSVAMERMRPFLPQHDSPERQATFEKLLASDPADLRSLIDHLNARYGGVEAYVKQLGLSPNQIYRIRERLIQPYAPQGDAR